MIYSSLLVEFIMIDCKFLSVSDYINKLNANFVVVKWNTNFNFTDESGKSEQMYDEAECLSRLLNIFHKMGADSLKFHLIAHDYKVTVFSLAAQMAYPVLIGRISGKNVQVLALL